MWICTNCGHERFNALPQVATWHTGTCDVCGKADVVVTEERDFKLAATLNKLAELGAGAHVSDEALSRENLY